MRLHQKNQCHETIQLFNEAHREIEKFIEKQQIDKALNLLEQCQQGAISVGTLIDNTEGEGTEAVHCLEEYCELLYQLHENLFQGIPVNVRQIQKKMKKSLSRAENSLRYDISTQREVVFLPYKASMWDSLESVWKAAAEDPDCNAVVIPIPYYDKNPDGSFREMHYEIEQFPIDVPVVKYDAYDFENRHPDIIFFHNPYDDGNYVTSVHPFFFSKNLKQYTDKLIYIPYFILEEIDPSDQEAVEEMEHFCTVAGVFHADYIVVQSESMKQIYVDVLTKYSDESMRSYWQNKILGLGSPKVDRVCNLRSEDFVLPDAWEKLIQKKDGGRKKIILYNTSVTALLKNDEKMLAKIKENLKIFKENSTEMVLLWRPHPLTEATLLSMRPELWEKYEELVKDYKEAGWGIYDDSADMDRAIAVSDGYYGDWSSIVWLYQHTGKPIMIQNVDI